ncbi:hypothetical protein [Psychrosphaera algicola]|uniref:CHAT domain-containing protein n=1 Tax=Psychrosphaera algicola TaxID=3023714 RepID=A0ABT5FJW7_9GAMM|nr:hypothetical protein [Psychrosphaera sp. G1-22]MDC2891499.1 hypothetical protein [Psychrosphaera sp. G1-22]
MEADKISQQLGWEKYLDDQASKQVVLASLASNEYIHIATHGLSENAESNILESSFDNPANFLIKNKSFLNGSSIALAGSSGNRNDIHHLSVQDLLTADKVNAQFAFYQSVKVHMVKFILAKCHLALLEH